MICVRYERISESATMAQVVERILGKDEVGGSSPPSSSKSTSFGSAFSVISTCQERLLYDKIYITQNVVSI